MDLSFPVSSAGDDLITGENIAATGQTIWVARSHSANLRAAKSSMSFATPLSSDVSLTHQHSKTQHLWSDTQKLTSAPHRGIADRCRVCVLCFSWCGVCGVRWILWHINTSRMRQEWQMILEFAKIAHLPWVSRLFSEGYYRTEELFKTANPPAGWVMNSRFDEGQENSVSITSSTRWCMYVSFQPWLNFRSAHPTIVTTFHFFSFPQFTNCIRILIYIRNHEIIEINCNRVTSGLNWRAFGNFNAGF